MMAKNHLTIVMIFLLPFIAISQEDSLKLTTGSFGLTQGPYKGNYQIIRTDSTQTDIDKIYNSKTEYKIIWIAFCNYRLQLLKGEIHKGFYGYELGKLIFNIAITNKNGYTYLLIEEESNILIDTTSLSKD
jgi:hypothetical protein